MQSAKAKKLGENLLQLHIKQRAKQPTVAHMVESIIGCKWSLQVLSLIRQGVCRPGAMTCAIDGLRAFALVFDQHVGLLRSHFHFSSDASQHLPNHGCGDEWH